MVANWFDKAAKYLYAYSGTMSFLEWKDIIKQTYKEHERQLGISGAQAMTIAMVAYYCIEVGSMYKGRQAASKFRSCNRWPDFSVPDPYWKDEWEQRRKQDERVQEIEALLGAVGKRLPPDKLEYSNWSRDALYGLLDIIKQRHGKEIAQAIEPEVRELISLYSGFAVLNFINARKILWDRELIPNMVTTYFIQRALVEYYGETLVDMKLAELEGRV